MFRHQHAQNPAYRRWCEAVGAAPGAVTAPADIPAVPVAAFKELELVCGTPAAEFRTSGTTGTGPGRHLLPALDLYRASALTWFSRCVQPEGWNLRTFLLAPPPEQAPHSSLSRMLAWVVEERAEEGSGWFVGPGGVAHDQLAEALLDAQRGGVPVLVAGTSAAFLSFYAYAERTGVAVRLPGGSRVMDTGGMKGSGVADPLPLEEFQARFRRRTESLLGVPPDRCVNEYGMTELSSQLYDSVLLDKHEVRTRPRVKLAPPWLRVTAVDPVTLAPLPDGASGLLRFLDLANAESVSAVLTEDFGRVEGEGLVLEGRAHAAEVRGCGRTFEELLPRS